MTFGTEAPDESWGRAVLKEQWSHSYRCLMYIYIYTYNIYIYVLLFSQFFCSASRFLNILLRPAGSVLMVSGIGI